MKDHLDVFLQVYKELSSMDSYLGWRRPLSPEESLHFGDLAKGLGLPWRGTVLYEVCMQKLYEIPPEETDAQVRRIMADRKKAASGMVDHILYARQRLEQGVPLDDTDSRRFQECALHYKEACFLLNIKFCARWDMQKQEVQQLEARITTEAPAPQVQQALNQLAQRKKVLEHNINRMKNDWNRFVSN